MIRFIAEHKDHQVAAPDGGAGLRWGVESMCAVLCEHGVPISASTYYEWIAKTPTRREVRDAELVEIIAAAREDKKTGKFVQTLGSRKLWIWLRGQDRYVSMLRRYLVVHGLRLRFRAFWGDVIICLLLCIVFVVIWRAHGIIYGIGETLRDAP